MWIYKNEALHDNQKVLWKDWIKWLLLSFWPHKHHGIYFSWIAGNASFIVAQRVNQNGQRKMCPL